MAKPQRNDDAAARPAAFDAQVLRYYPGLLNAARRMVRGNDNHVDLANDTVAGALRKWTSYRQDGGMWNWLYFLMRDIRRTKFKPLRYADIAGNDNHQNDHYQHDHESRIDSLAALSWFSAHRFASATRLRLLGYGFDEIGARLGISSQAASRQVAVVVAEYRKTHGVK